MALFLALYLSLRFGFQRTAVSRHPALWSPDLPPVAMQHIATSDCLACFGRYCTAEAGLTRLQLYSLLLSILRFKDSSAG